MFQPGARRGGMKQATSDTFGVNPFRILKLSPDEVDYFYGAFCEIGGGKEWQEAQHEMLLSEVH
jgi:hypothetical protein